MGIVDTGGLAGSVRLRRACKHRRDGGVLRHTEAAPGRGVVVPLPAAAEQAAHLRSEFAGFVSPPPRSSGSRTSGAASSRGSCRRPSSSSSRATGTSAASRRGSRRRPSPSSSSSRATGTSAASLDLARPPLPPPFIACSPFVVVVSSPRFLMVIFAPSSSPAGCPPPLLRPTQVPLPGLAVHAPGATDRRECSAGCGDGGK